MLRLAAMVVTFSQYFDEFIIVVTCGTLCSIRWSHKIPVYPRLLMLASLSFHTKIGDLNNDA